MPLFTPTLHNNQLRPLPTYGTHFYIGNGILPYHTGWRHSKVEWALPGLFHLEGNQVLLPPQWAGHIPCWNGLYQACSIVHNQAMKSQSHTIQGLGLSFVLVGLNPKSLCLHTLPSQGQFPHQIINPLNNAMNFVGN